jgi:predicted ATP-dependent endonuclease of OLD family
MALMKMALENFTAFDRIEVNFSPGINVFIGDNGTGKTHVLKILYSFCESENEPSFFVKLNHCMISQYMGDSFNFAKFHDNNTRIVPIQKIDVIADGKKLDAVRKLIDIHIDASMEKIDDEKQQRDNASKTLKISAAFIPAKEMLTHAGLEKDYLQRILPLDDTLIDIINKCGLSEIRELSPGLTIISNKIKDVIGGDIRFEDNQYAIVRYGKYIGFQKEAEGYKKFSCLWRLIATGILQKGSVLFWDEPEANINPKHIPILVDILYALQKQGVQIFVATHDYLLAKYFEVRKTTEHALIFHAFFRTNEVNASVQVESDDSFTLLENNSIIKQNIALYREEVGGIL